MGDTKDFFISYTQTDRAAAEWIAWQLEAAGYSVLLQAWDFQPGQNFVLATDRASQQAGRPHAGAAVARRPGAGTLAARVGAQTLGERLQSALCFEALRPVV